ncbi:MAG: DNA recombination protein RmuC [Lentisphaerae bacterium]|nr:DNA recombination protein RmuC [Lentisphaerota bacterium]
MDFLLPVLIILAAVGLAAWWLRRALLAALHPEREAPALLLLQKELQAGIAQTTRESQALQQHLREELRLLNEQVARALTEANRTVGDRLDNTAKVIGDVRERLGQMDEASKRIFDVGRDIAELQQALSAPKLRGGLSEYMLAELLDEVLPRESYALQYKFKGGETVDAVIRLSSGLAAIDAKFPLENFRRSLAAQDDAERLAAGKQFTRDVKKHIDDIARKYIRTDEGTFDFALMYIPAENVYYGVIICAEGSAEETLLQYALRRRVIPVSPNSFFAYLQTILLGLRGLRVEESAREIMDNLARLTKELESFAEDFRIVGQHLGNAQKRYEEADRRLSRVEVKLEQMSGFSKAVEGAGAAALPAVQ